MHISLAMIMFIVIVTILTFIIHRIFGNRCYCTSCKSHGMTCRCHKCGTHKHDHDHGCMCDKCKCKCSQCKSHTIECKCGQCMTHTVQHGHDCECDKCKSHPTDCDCAICRKNHHHVCDANCLEHIGNDEHIVESVMNDEGVPSYDNYVSSR